MSLRCTIPEIFGSEHSKQKCEPCEQTASTCEFISELGSHAIGLTRELGSHTIGLASNQSRTIFITGEPTKFLVV